MRLSAIHRIGVSPGSTSGNSGPGLKKPFVVVVVVVVVCLFSLIKLLFVVTVFHISDHQSINQLQLSRQLCVIVDR